MSRRALKLKDDQTLVEASFKREQISEDMKNEPKTSEFDEVKDKIVQQLIQKNQEKKYIDVMKELENKYEVKRA